MAPKLDIALYAVDARCIVPMACFEKREYAAYTPRVSEFHTPVTRANIAALVASCQIDHAVPPSVSIAGGRLAAQKQLAHFLRHGLARYAAESKEPSAHATCGLSPNTVQLRGISVRQTIVLCRLPRRKSGRPQKAMVCPTK
jgi:deoxyribodipyrimidine photolyase